MDPFAIVILIGVLIVLTGAILAARSSSGRPLREFGARPPARDPLDAEDLEQLLAATNARRHARGQPERSLGDAIREFGDG